LNLCSIRWAGGDLARPGGWPADRGAAAACAELLGVDLATVCKLTAKVEPYLRADGTRIWSLMQLGGSSGPRCRPAPRRLPRPPTDPGCRCLINPGVGAHGIRAVKCDSPSPTLSLTSCIPYTDLRPITADTAIDLRF
jgi:hypothetical protein